MTVATLGPDAARLAREIGPGELNRLLGLPRHRRLDGVVAELAEWARAWFAERGRPYVRVRRHAIAELSADGILLGGGQRLADRGLADHLRRYHAHALAAIAVSAGEGLDEACAALWKEGRPDAAYFLERLGVAVVEHLLLSTTLEFCRDSEQAGETLSLHASPGCGTTELSTQHTLWPLLFPDDEPGPIRLLPSGGLSPKNALLAVSGITRRPVPRSPLDACRSCSLAACGFRRARYGGPA